MRGLTRCYI